MRGEDDDGVRWGLEDTLLYASDYPHWDHDWPHTVSSIWKRDDLSDSVKRKMLHDNAVRLYGRVIEAETPALKAPTAGTRSPAQLSASPFPEDATEHAERHESVVRDSSAGGKPKTADACALQPGRL